MNDMPPSSAATTSLNPQQQRAVAHSDGALLLLAGAGSGKTRCLTARIAQLIESGVAADTILAVTFTNKAAREMKQRVLTLTDHDVLVSTFHSLGARILRESIHHLGYDNGFVIYDEEDSDKLLKSCIDELGLHDEKVDRKLVKSKISLAKDSCKGPDAITDNRYHVADIYRLYQQRLEEAHALDFDDLLFLVARLFRDCPEVLGRYQERWRYLLIDEYQDTNQVQYFITKELVASSGNLFAVGDPDQSIYSWRGADIGNILNFERDFPNAEVLLLEQNYRSTCHILNAANGLISYNFHRYEKQLWSDLGDGDPVYLFRAYDEREEARFVAEQVATHQRAGIPLTEMAVLYRANFQSRPFEDALYDVGVPCVIVGGVSFYRRREVKDILAFLRLIESENDTIAFTRTINLPKRGIGAKTIEALRAGAAEAGVSILAFCRTPDTALVRLTKKQRQALEEYIAIIDSLKASSTTQTIDRLITTTVDASGYRSHLERDPDSYDDRLDNLQELCNKAAEWEGGTLSEFLQELALKTDLDEAVADDHLSLMTLHNAKGLEFRVAFIVGMEADLLPHVKARSSEEALEEERRLCYVGMTRAQERLYLTHSSQRRSWGGEIKRQYPSRFLQEIPYQHCREL